MLPKPLKIPLDEVLVEVVACRLLLLVGCSLLVGYKNHTIALEL